MRNKSYLARVDALIETAREQVGYRSRAMRVNQYGARLALDGQPWAGIFLETVMRDAKELTQPSLVHTASALAAYARAGREFRVPKIGDLVFYAFPSESGFGQPHIGLVTDVTDWKITGSFKAIEGNTASGLSKGPQDPDGVYERTRFSTDVLTFVRPKYESIGGKVMPQAELSIHPSHITRKNVKAITAIQLALADTVGARGLTKGVPDAAMKSAVQAYQRRIGAPDNGVIDDVFIVRLALDTEFKYFKAQDIG
jgi:hypothetical protein